MSNSRRVCTWSAVQLRKRLLFGLVVVAVASGIYHYQKHLARRIHDELEREFIRIVPAPGSIPTNHESTYKAGTSLVQAEYRSSVPFSNIKAHYKSELERYGWQLRSDRIINDSFSRQDLEEVVFCKGNFAASVSRRDHGSSDSVFWFALSWGLHDCS